MSPPPLRRSIPFWSCILAIGIIILAWWDSVKYGSFAYSSSWVVRNELGALEIGRIEAPGLRGAVRQPNPQFTYFKVSLAGFLYYTLPSPIFARGEGAPEDHGPFPRNERRENFIRIAIQRPPHCWDACIPYWLILPIPTLLLCGIILRRAWKVHRLREDAVPMLPGAPPLHRSITFWSGIAVMFSFGWLWQASMKTHINLYHSPYALSSGRGLISLSNRMITPSSGMTTYQLRDQTRLTMWAFPPPLIRRGGEKPIHIYFSDALAFMDSADREMEKAPRGTWRLMLPYWLLFLSSASVWILLLLWRGVRHRRARAAQQAIIPETSP